MPSPDNPDQEAEDPLFPTPPNDPRILKHIATSFGVYRQKKNGKGPDSATIINFVNEAYMDVYKRRPKTGEINEVIGKLLRYNDGKVREEEEEATTRVKREEVDRSSENRRGQGEGKRGRKGQRQLGGERADGQGEDEVQQGEGGDFHGEEQREDKEEDKKLGNHRLREETEIDIPAPATPEDEDQNQNDAAPLQQEDENILGQFYATNFRAGRITSCLVTFTLFYTLVFLPVYSLATADSSKIATIAAPINTLSTWGDDLAQATANLDSTQQHLTKCHTTRCHGFEAMMYLSPGGGKDGGNVELYREGEKVWNSTDVLRFCPRPPEPEAVAVSAQHEWRDKLTQHVFAATRPIGVGIVHMDTALSMLWNGTRDMSQVQTKLSNLTARLSKREPLRLTNGFESYLLKTCGLTSVPSLWAWWARLHCPVVYLWIVIRIQSQELNMTAWTGDDVRQFNSHIDDFQTTLLETYQTAGREMKLAIEAGDAIDPAVNELENEVRAMETSAEDTDEFHADLREAGRYFTQNNALSWTAKEFAKLERRIMQENRQRIVFFESSWWLPGDVVLVLDGASKFERQKSDRALKRAAEGKMLGMTFAREHVAKAMSWTQLSNSTADPAA